MFFLKKVRTTFLIIIFLGILVSDIVFCQAIDFLNTSTLQLLLNPANTGNHQFDWNIYDIYNSKQIVANNNFSSLYLAGDYQLYLFPDKISFGAGVQRNSIYNTPVNENQVFFSAAYHKKMNQHEIHFGVQPLFVFYELASSELLFPDQYDRNTGGYNSAIPTSEFIENDKINYLDLYIGAAYSIRHNKMKPEIGFSMYHLTKPSVSYISDSDKLQMDVGFYVKSDYYYSPNMVITPGINLTTKQDLVQVLIGSDAHYGINRNAIFVRSFMAGIHFLARNGEYPNSLIFNLGTKINRLNIVLAYNNSITSKNKLPNNIQTFEIALIFNGFNSNIDKYSVPCEIF